MGQAHSAAMSDDVAVRYAADPFHWLEDEHSSATADRLDE